MGDTMRINAKGQVTIPAALRSRFGSRQGDEVDVVADGEAPRIVRVPGRDTRGRRMVRRLRVSRTAPDTAGMSTDELMALLRG
ncbi:AbrB family looped-hinge helix DNA binding protein [Murinocardiopsis flavida]|uniref:AbrB family looped-hinge helix DNA binding protein n=1 Tax=Murinocardiopsis flavida TaxID=645275 RepID=A0A2P8D6V2_9ACTN|nr:AbrB/MazE/SpoVT family DNA-binding domain-containing protein [Murinocardiopsis flavida]PSK92921.1 AbrB family looped-hinge helix DNA binding protein [Murinocardiopsis flavida]